MKISSIIAISSEVNRLNEIFSTDFDFIKKVAKCIKISAEEVSLIEKWELSHIEKIREEELKINSDESMTKDEKIKAAQEKTIEFSKQKMEFLNSDSKSELDTIRFTEDEMKVNGNVMSGISNVIIHLTDILN